MPNGLIIPPKEECVDAVRTLALDAARHYATGDPWSQSFGREIRAKKLIAQAYAKIGTSTMLDDLLAAVMKADAASPDDHQTLAEAYTEAREACGDLYDKFDHLSFDESERAGL